MDKIKPFEEVLSHFELEDMKKYCIEMINKMPDYIFQIPSSTSYKYHNATQCQPGGQLYHIIMVATIANYLLDLEYIRESKFQQEIQRDCIRIAAILHDAQKTGGGKYTVHEHPTLAAKWIIEEQTETEVSDKTKKTIAWLVESHSGQWVDSKKSKHILPKPETDAQFFIHLCDYLGSRSNIDMIYSKEVINAVKEINDIPIIADENLTMPYGKYKGALISEIPNDYIQWLLENTQVREPYKTIFEAKINNDKTD